jgi:hypothetical protein
LRPLNGLAYQTVKLIVTEAGLKEVPWRR